MKSSMFLLSSLSKSPTIVVEPAFPHERAFSFQTQPITGYTKETLLCHSLPISQPKKATLQWPVGAGALLNTTHLLNAFETWKLEQQIQQGLDTAVCNPLADSVEQKGGKAQFKIRNHGVALGTYRS